MKRILSLFWGFSLSACAGSYLYDGGLARMLASGGTIKDTVTVGGPLYVAQPAWPVWVAHQVCVEGDGVHAGIT